MALIADATSGAAFALDAGVSDLPILSVSEMLAAIRVQDHGIANALKEARVMSEADAPTTPASALVYVFTGGTTKASKCVCVTHAMALWEASNYQTALFGAARVVDRFLQYSTLFWRAAVFGQLSIGLAVGGCICVGGSPLGCRGSADALSQLACDVKSFGITVLGVVPSQLRGAWPGGPASARESLRMLIVWADKCPVELSRRWRDGGVPVVDLLLASEYWLALYSDCRSYNDGVEKHVYRQLPTLDARFLVEDGTVLRDARVGEVGEMHLSGPTVSPGCVCPDGRISLERFGATRQVDGKKYLRARDLLCLLPSGGLVYSGRADSLLKHGGAWVDADALQDATLAVRGVTQAAIVPCATGIDAFVVLQTQQHALNHKEQDENETNGDAHSPAPKRLCLGQIPSYRVLSDVRRVLPSGSGTRVHLRTELPFHPATSKIDRGALTAQLTSMADEMRRHSDKHDAIEKGHVQCFAVWLRLALTMLCVPQTVVCVILALISYRCSSRTDHVLRLARLCYGCILRLAFLPCFWLAITYVEHRCGPAPGWVASRLKRVHLPAQYSRWLPLVLAAWLPSSWVETAGACACAYVGWARERDPWLVGGFGFLAALASVVPASWVLLTAAVTTASISSRATEFVTFILSGIGL